LSGSNDGDGGGGRRIDGLSIGVEGDSIYALGGRVKPRVRGGQEGKELDVGKLKTPVALMV
jgi:hypothetical protein